MKKMQLKPWQKSWSLHLTRLTLSLSIPPTCMWWVIHVSQWLSHVFPKYLKVIEIDTVHVLGFIEGKQCFSSIVFLKNKTHNRLNNQLHLVVFMYTHKFSHLAPFHTRLHIRCGLMFNQQMTKDNMLEFCYCFCAPLFNLLVVKKHFLSLCLLANSLLTSNAHN